MTNDERILALVKRMMSKPAKPLALLTPDGWTWHPSCPQGTREQLMAERDAALRYHGLEPLTDAERAAEKEQERR